MKKIQLTVAFVTLITLNGVTFASDSSEQLPIAPKFSAPSYGSINQGLQELSVENAKRISEENQLKKPLDCGWGAACSVPPSYTNIE